MISRHTFSTRDCIIPSYLSYILMQMKNSTKGVDLVSLHAEDRRLGIGAIAYIARHPIGYARRSDRGAFADRQPCQNVGMTTDRGTPLDASFNYGLVSFGLQTAIKSSRSWIDVVGEHYPMTDKYFIFDLDTLAQKAMR
jgi:hypothetical protein